jgi:CRISPR-associated protein Cmr1
MQEVIFNLRTLTPLFLAGNDQAELKIPIDTRKQGARINTDYYAWKLLAELRSPPFRGLMRYWQRALVGGALTLEDMIKLEASIFGATDTGSAVSIKVSKPSKEPRDFWKEGKGREPTGKDYLLWSMARTGSIEKDNYKFPRQYYPDNTEFQVMLSVHGQGETERKILDQAIVAFWLLTYLGGIGSRSRRCAGSLTVENIQANTVQILKDQLEQGRGITLQDTKGNTSKLSFVKPETANELKAQLEAGIQSARLLYDIDLVSTQYNAQFDILAHGACGIWILQDEDRQPWPTSEKAIEDIGNSLQNYRGSILDLQLREIFGLPLGKNQARRASPLHLRITELHGGKYVGVAVLFKTTGTDISTGRQITLNDYKRIEDWITTSTLLRALYVSIELCDRIDTRHGARSLFRQAQ